MSELSMLDLPYYLDQMGGTSQLTLVGVIEGEIEQPYHLQTLGFKSSRDRYAVMDLVGVDINGAKYYVKGKACIVADVNILEDAKKKGSGRLAVCAVNASVKSVDRNIESDNFIQSMRWFKPQQGAKYWDVGRIKLTPLKEVQYPEFFEVVKNAYRNNWEFTFPVPIPNGYSEASMGYDFEVIGKPKVAKTVARRSPSTESKASILPQQHPQHPINDPKNRQPQEDTEIAPSIAKWGSNDENKNKTKRNPTPVETQSNKKRAKLKVESRDKLLPITENVRTIRDCIDTADDKVSESMSLLDEYKIGDSGDTPYIIKVTDAVNYCGEQLKRHWRSKAGWSTGQMLFKSAVDSLFPEYTAGTTSAYQTLVDLRREGIVDEFMRGETKPFDYNNITKEEKLCELLFENRVELYLKMIEISLGIHGRLLSAYSRTQAEGLDIMTLLETNPYLISLLDPRIPIGDLDKLAFLYGVNITKEPIVTSRNVSFMHNYMLDSTNPIVGDSTTVLLKDIHREVRGGIIITKREYDNLQLEGVIIPELKIESLKHFIREDVRKENFSLPTVGWKKGFNKFVLELGQNTGKVVQDYIDSGLGVPMTIDGEDYLADFILAHKEMYIYTRLRELCERAKKVTLEEEQINLCIAKFEAMKAKELGLPEGGYKLEERQKDSVRFIGNGAMCLTGPAGSGKTTSAELLVYALETLMDIQPKKIMFAAPTGKAATRLKEVVKRPTRTVNSLFGIGGENLTITNEEDVRKHEDMDVLVLDESSMPNVHLMYDMVMRLETGTRVYFLGDRAQLPPIGAGKPYATLLTFLPTVALNVAKRASDKSGITRNAKMVNEESDGVVEDLIDTDDFRIINSNNQMQVVDSVLNICRYHLGLSTPSGFRPVTNLGAGLHPDDIQVITPINKQNWGTIALNKELQNVFNPKNPNKVSILQSKGNNEKIEFRIGDRVIHCKANDKERVRLIKIDTKKFDLADNTGINNGDVGHIEGIYNGHEIEFNELMGDVQLSQLESMYRSNQNKLLIAVKFKDTDTETNEEYEYVILYKADVLLRSGSYIDVASNDLKFLDLAYALTVHKLQGSQAKLVISLFLPVGRGTFSSNFISRNIIYTAITRAQEAEYLVGDILGKNSCVNVGRAVEQNERRLATLDLIG